MLLLSPFVNIFTFSSPFLLILELREMLTQSTRRALCEQWECRGLHPGKLQYLQGQQAHPSYSEIVHLHAGMKAP